MLRLIMEFIGGMLISLLPPRYRIHFASKDARELERPAWVSGLLQIVIPILFLIAELYSTYGVIAPDRDLAKEAFNDQLLGASHPGSGIFAFFNFAFTPSHFVALYFMFEGVVRVFSAGFSGHTVGTLPLYFISGIHNWLEPRVHEKRMGARIADEIYPGDEDTYALKILSCRPKPDWHRNITIRYQEEFYQMFREEPGDKPRPFVFYLRRPPLGHLVVVIRDYSPTDVLRTSRSSSL